MGVPLSALVERAIDAAGLSGIAAARRSGAIATTDLARLRHADLLALGALAAQPVILFNPEGRTANYIIPGLVAVLLQLLGIVLSAGAIVRERERGTLEQLLVTPINPLGLMLGKLGPYLLLSLVEMTLILLAMRFGFDVPIRGKLALPRLLRQVCHLSVESRDLLRRESQLIRDRRTAEAAAGQPPIVEHSLATWTFVAHSSQVAERRN